MRDPYIPVPADEREALQWLFRALDRPLRNMPNDEFMRAWCAVFYLHGGLHPDGAHDHGTEIELNNDGPFRFQLIEPRLISPSYTETGWPLVLAPLSIEAWRRYELGELSDDEIYCADAQYAGFENRYGGSTGLRSTPLIN